MVLNAGSGTRHVLVFPAFRAKSSPDVILDLAPNPYLTQLQTQVSTGKACMSTWRVTSKTKDWVPELSWDRTLHFFPKTRLA